MLKWENWLHGLVGGFIGGGATAVTSATGLWAAKASGVDVPVLNLKAVGILFVSAGLISAFTYLKQSPLPPNDQTETKP